MDFLKMNLNKSAWKNMFIILWPFLVLLYSKLPFFTNVLVKLSVFHARPPDAIVEFLTVPESRLRAFTGSTRTIESEKRSFGL
jgi:hypothetical protein